MNATRKAAEGRRKLIEFDQETWQALDLLARDSMQERSGTRRRGLSRPPAQAWTSDRPEGRAEGERAAVACAGARKILHPPQRSLACTQVAGGGAKKHRRLPSGRLQRQNAPSGDGCASVKGIFSFPKIR